MADTGSQSIFFLLLGQRKKVMKTREWEKKRGKQRGRSTKTKSGDFEKP